MVKIKWSKCIIIVTGLVILGVCLLPVKKNIDTTINAIQWEINNEDSFENIKVQVRGTYNRYLFKRNYFDGEINIEGYEQYDNLELQTVYFTDDVGYLIYEDKEDYLNIENLGFLICSADFNEILIGVYSDSGSWTSDDGILICGNASDYNESLKIAEELAKKSEWLSNSKVNE